MLPRTAPVVNILLMVAFALDNEIKGFERFLFYAYVVYSGTFVNVIFAVSYRRSIAI